MKFTVEWRRPFCWRVCAEHKYVGKWIGDFWTESKARAVADRLNRYIEEKPQIEADEISYDCSLLK